MSEPTLADLINVCVNRNTQKNGNNQIPTADEVAEVYNSLMSVSAQCLMIYGSNCKTIQKVLQFWVKLGLHELEKIESEKYEPRFIGATFPIYDENCNIIG